MTARIVLGEAMVDSLYQSFQTELSDREFDDPLIDFALINALRSERRADVDAATLSSL